MTLHTNKAPPKIVLEIAVHPFCRAALFIAHSFMGSTVDMRVLKALKKSPLALDLYAWATYTAYQTQKTGQSRSLSWNLLHEQFGAEYHNMDEFARNAWKALSKVKAVYPELNLERIRGGINVLPSKPSITIKQKDSKTYPLNVEN